MKKKTNKKTCKIIMNTWVQFWSKITDTLLLTAQVSDLIAPILKKRGRKPLSEEVKTSREKVKLEVKQAAKRAKFWRIPRVTDYQILF